MGMKGLIVVFILFAFSFLVLNPSLNVMPNWIRDNAELYQLTIIIWMVSFALAFTMFGLEMK